jgi:transposase
MHVLSDANGLPLRVGLSAANTHDSLALKPMLSHFPMGHESHATDSKPVRLHADKAYDVPHLRRWLWGKHIGVRIARKGIDSSERLGRRRWVVERTMSWLTGYRRLNHRYERKPPAKPGSGSLAAYGSGFTAASQLVTTGRRSATGLVPTTSRPPSTGSLGCRAQADQHISLPRQQQYLTRSSGLGATVRQPGRRQPQTVTKDRG